MNGSRFRIVGKQRECDSFVQMLVGIDIPSGGSYRGVVMIARALSSDSPSASDPHVGATGGLYAFARFYLGYAYVYAFLLTAGGS